MCISPYAQTFVSGHGNWLAISSKISASVLIDTVSNERPYPFSGPEYEWILILYWQQNVSSIKYILQRAASWVVSDDGSDLYHVQYCLSEPVEERCRVQFSMVIMSVSILCNFLKALCMLLTLRLQYFRPLVTPGDAMESFLRRADSTTMGMCLAGIAWFSQDRWGKAPMKRKALQSRWFLSASRPRRLTCNIL